MVSADLAVPLGARIVQERCNFLYLLDPLPALVILRMCKNKGTIPNRETMAGEMSMSWFALTALLVLSSCSWMLAGETCSLSGTRLAVLALFRFNIRLFYYGDHNFISMHECSCWH